MSLTKRQREVLFAFAQITTVLGHRPTLAELSEELGVCRTTIHEHLRIIATKGYLAQSEGVYQKRGYSLTAKGRQLTAVGLELLKNAWRSASEHDRERFITWATTPRKATA